MYCIYSSRCKVRKQRRSSSAETRSSEGLGLVAALLFSWQDFIPSNK